MNIPQGFILTLAFAAAAALGLSFAGINVVIGLVVIMALNVSKSSIDVLGMVFLLGSKSILSLSTRMSRFFLKSQCDSPERKKDDLRVRTVIEPSVEQTRMPTATPEWESSVIVSSLVG